MVAPETRSETRTSTFRTKYDTNRQNTPYSDHLSSFRPSRDYPANHNNNGVPLATSSSSSSTTPPSFVSSLLAGGMAGTCVDVALYPIDTLKTRLQAPGGFWKAGGFRGLYQGLGAAAVGSAPGAALFFGTYEQAKVVLEDTQFGNQPETAAWRHMTAASAGEFMACLVRVPTEVIKARMQTSQVPHLTIRETIQSICNEPIRDSVSGSKSSAKGAVNLYRGFGITLFREIPFSMIQFPLYEWGKLMCSEQFNQGQGCPPLAAAACGSASGAIAGGLTTPLDVLKTRFMLGKDVDGHAYKNVWDVLRRTCQQEGVGALWHGWQPRVFWISLGGFVFFGAYETSLKLVRPVFR